MRFLWVLVLLPLAACLDADATFTVDEDENVFADVTVTLSRQLHDMIALSGEGAEGFCPKHADKTIGAETVVCKFSETTTVAETIVEADKAADHEPFMKDAKIERVDDEQLRITMPLEFDQIEGRPAELSEENPMFDMMVGGLTGHSLVFRFKALEIVSSNGVITDDGTTVELVIPVVELLKPSGDLPDEFTALMKYRDCGLFGC